MDIVVHGTKLGRQTFTPKKIGGLLDVSPDSSSPSAIGQEAFAIRLIENTIIFSKYKIIRDVRGEKRIGFLAFSLILSSRKKLLGINIISLLNEVSEEYCKRYMPENDNNLKYVTEDWKFLDRISEEYKRKLLPVPAEDVENIMSGTKDDAFIYYWSEEELQKYFNTPHQEDYSKFRQVLFVKGELKDRPENPLNALRHSDDDLTGKIDLDNPKYKLLYNQTSKGGVLINVKVNGITRSSQSKINRKDVLEISWSKQYCKTVTQKGKWNEISNEYINVNDTSETVSINEIIPPEETKTITFRIKDWKGRELNDGKIFCKNADYNKSVINNQIIFKGEDIGKRWLVSANNERFFSEVTPINIIKDCLSDTATIDIILNKHELNKNQVTVLDESNGDIINKFTLSKTVFTGSEITDTHKIAVSCIGFNPDYFKYCPEKDESRIAIRLKKIQNSVPDPNTQSYTVDAGAHGILKGGGKTTSASKDGFDVKHLIIPNDGWRFSRFEEKVGTIVAQYEKKKPFFSTPKIITGLIVLATVLGFCIWQFISLFGKGGSGPESALIQQPKIQQIESYIEGNLLILDTLYSYKNTPSLNQNDLLSKLDSAIQKRQFINNWNISELKRMSFSHAQLKFRTAIINIDSARYKDIREKFRDVSAWSLGKIADSINVFLNVVTLVSENKIKRKDEVKKEITDTKKEREENSEEEEETYHADPSSNKKENKQEPTKDIKQRSNSEDKKEIKSGASNTSNANNITLELQSPTVTKGKIKNWKTEGMDRYNRSIDLYLTFWSIVSSNQKEEFDNLLKDVETDPILKNSALKNFLKSICRTSDAFQKYNKVSGKATCKTIAELTELKNKEQ